MEEHTLFARLLGVAPPWQVTEVLISEASQTVTLRVELPPPRGGLFSRRPAAPVRQLLRWEHVALAGMRCKVMVALRGGNVLPQAAWTAEADQPYTRGLQRQIMDLLLAGATPEQLAVLLRLPFADIWRYKFRLDQGQTKPSPVAPAPRLPAADAPVWTALLLGRAALDVRTLGLRLLLTKLQREASLHGDADLHRQAARELHRYFDRSQAVLRHEIGQLAGLAAERPTTPPPARHATAALPADGTPVPAYELPEPSDPLWMALLDGRCELNVRALGLRLLLAKLRTQISAISDDDVRMIKLVELHRYFARHKAGLGHEIAQLRDWRGA